MEIKFNSNSQNISSCPSPYFKGKGLDLINKFQSDKAMRMEYYIDIANDLSDGARQYFRKNKDVDNSVTSFHKSGGLTVWFDIPNNEILKISLENPLQYRKHNPEFDIPFLTPVEKFGKTYIVRQPKADTEIITRQQVLEVMRKIYANWCELSKDGNKYEQYGVYNGKPYLIDTRCAMPMPNLYTIVIDKLYWKINKCYRVLTKAEGEEEFAQKVKRKGYFAYHIDETPRKSLSFLEGIKKLAGAVKRNIKYRKNNYAIPYEEYKSGMKIPELQEM